MQTTSLLKVGPFVETSGGGTTERCRDAPSAARATTAIATSFSSLRMATSQLSSAANDFLDPRPAGRAQLARVSAADVDARLHPVQQRPETEKGAREIDLHRMR